jgi:hypothetical protein
VRVIVTYQTFPVAKNPTPNHRRLPWQGKNIRLSVLAGFKANTASDGWKAITTVVCPVGCLFRLLDILRWFLAWLLDSEAGGSIFLRNFGKLLPDHTASNLRTRSVRRGHRFENLKLGINCDHWLNVINCYRTTWCHGIRDSAIQLIS